MGIDVGEEGKLNESERLALLATNGVFCFLKPSEKEFDDLPTIKQHWKEAVGEVGISKVRIGRFIAERYPCPSEVAEAMSRVRLYLNERL